MPTNNDNLFHWTAKLAGLGSTVWEGIIHSLKYAQFEAWLLINCSVCWQAFIIISLIPRPPGPHHLHGVCEGVNIVAFVPNKSPLVWTVSFTVVIEIWNCPSVLLVVLFVHVMLLARACAPTGGVFQVMLSFNEEFNTVPPKIHFLTIPFHPNGNHWTRPLTISFHPILQ